MHSLHHMSVRPHVSLAERLKGFNEIWYWNVSRKAVQPFNFPFISDNLNNQFTSEYESTNISVLRMRSSHQAYDPWSNWENKITFFVSFKFRVSKMEIWWTRKLVLSPCSSNRFFFFAWWRAPQQMLRTHRSLKASCATPVMKMSSFFFTKFYN